MFEFYNSTIRNNFALVASVSEIFSSMMQSVISGSNVTSNYIVTKEQILNDILSQGYIHDSFRQYIQSNLLVFDVSETKS